MAANRSQQACHKPHAFRGLAKLSGGIITMDMAEALLDIANGHFTKGFRQLACAYFSARKAKGKLFGIFDIKTNDQ